MVRKGLGIFLLYVVFVFSFCYVTQTTSISAVSPVGLNGGVVDESSPSRNSSIINGSPNYQPYNAVGTGGFNGKFSRIKIYVPKNQPAKITITQACDDSIELGQPRVTYYLDSLSADEHYRSGPYNGKYSQEMKGETNNGVCLKSLIFPTISNGHGVTSTISGHTEWKVFSLVAEIADSPSSNERSFQVTNSNGVTGASAPLDSIDKANNAPGGSNANESASYYGIYQKDAPQLGNQVWSYVTDFRPNCGEISSPRRVTVGFYDMDIGVYSPQSFDVDVYWANQSNGTPYGGWTPVSLDKNLPSGNHQVGSVSFTAQKNRAYRMIIEGINYWNTVQIKLPFDQVNTQPDFAQDCDISYSLRNDTQKTNEAGQYDNANDGTVNRQNRAVAALQAAQFQHSVWHALGADQSPSNSDSYVKAFTLRRDTGVWKEFDPARATFGNPNSIGGSLNPGDFRSITRIASASQLREHLYSGGRVPVAKGGWCATVQYNFAGNPIPNANSNCSTQDGNAWRWTSGDLYCEKIITNNFSSNFSGQTLDRPNPDGKFGPDNIKCVELSTYEPPCSALPWSVNHSADLTITHPDGSINGNPNDVWVGDTYTYNYELYNDHPQPTRDSGDWVQASRVWSQNKNDGSPVYFSGALDPASATWEAALNLGFQNFGPYSATVGESEGGYSYGSYFQYGSTASGDLKHDGTSFPPGSSNCGGNGEVRQAPPLGVTIPYYYHTIPKTSGSVPLQVQQGETISVNGLIKNPSDDQDGELMPGDHENGGRGHTYTQNIGWQRVVFRANNIADVNGKFTANGMRQGSGPGVCEVLGGIGIGGYRDCSVRDSGNTTLQIETKDLGLSGITLGLEPVGTVVCVALGIGDPTHSTSPSDWRIAQPKCTTIIKSPKVQFKYGDVAVGRERLGVSPTCTVNPTAKIQATSAPNVSLVSVDDTEKYKFGSWGEYGVFSSGSILSFGSSGAEAGTTDKAKRLSFGNTSSTYGNYPYGIKCLPNLMNGYSAENTIPTDTIYPNQYFTDPSRNTKSRFQRTGNINLTLEPTKTYQAILSLKGYSDCGNDVPNGPLTPAKVRFVVELVGGQKITSSDMEVSSCSESSRPTYQTTVQLGGDGWPGIKRVDLQFINNNHNAAWETNSSQMRDRNLFVESLKIQWVRNGSEEIATTPLMSAADSRVSRTHPDDYYSTAPGNIDSDALCRKTNTDGRWWIGGSAFPDGRVAVPSTLGDLGYLSGLCHGLHIDNLASSTDGRFDDSETPTPTLGPSYDGFRGRNIILYAKDTDNNCANNNGGNININLDMDYKRDGYTKLSEIPRFTLMADCNIVISNNVTQVRASLIAGDAIMTCSNRARTQGECNSKLTVTGAIQAKRLLLWRTSGADLTNIPDARIPAETFVYGVDQMMAGYEYGLVNPLLKPSYQRDLPPRY